MEVRRNLFNYKREERRESSHESSFLLIPESNWKEAERRERNTKVATTRDYCSVVCVFLCAICLVESRVSRCWTILYFVRIFPRVSLSINYQQPKRRLPPPLLPAPTTTLASWWLSRGGLDVDMRHGTVHRGAVWWPMRCDALSLFLSLSLV